VARVFPQARGGFGTLALVLVGLCCASSWAISAEPPWVSVVD
jgi:hypothetical protein